MLPQGQPQQVAAEKGADETDYLGRRRRKPAERLGAELGGVQGREAGSHLHQLFSGKKNKIF